MQDGNQTVAFDRREHVAAGCDENYALPLAVMLASIEANLASGVTVVAHVLQSGLQPATRETDAHGPIRTAIAASTTAAGVGRTARSSSSTESE